MLVIGLRILIVILASGSSFCWLCQSQETIPRFRCSRTALADSSAASAQNKLYKDQQAAKTRRAEVERTLLRPGVELLEEVYKSAAGSGFGAATSSKAKALQISEALRDNGVVRLNNCIKETTASLLKALVIEEMEIEEAKEIIVEEETADQEKEDLQEDILDPTIETILDLTEEEILKVTNIEMNQEMTNIEMKENLEKCLILLNYFNFIKLQKY
jgi:hypothetical protein